MDIFTNFTTLKHSFSVKFNFSSFMFFFLREKGGLILTRLIDLIFSNFFKTEILQIYLRMSLKKKA